MPNEYPEHEKLKALGGANETIGDFLQWLDQHGYTVCERYEGERGQGYHTIAIVATTPQTRLSTKTILATSNILLASGSENDGHIPMPFWFPLGAIIIVILAGIVGIFPPLGRRAM